MIWTHHDMTWLCSSLQLCPTFAHQEPALESILGCIFPDACLAHCHHFGLCAQGMGHRAVGTLGLCASRGMCFQMFWQKLQIIPFICHSLRSLYYPIQQASVPCHFLSVVKVWAMFSTVYIVYIFSLNWLTLIREKEHFFYRKNFITAWSRNPILQAINRLCL